MSDFLTLARPYAKACYDYALEKNQVESWHKLLINLSELINNSEMQVILNAPEAESGLIEKIVLSVLEADNAEKNFLKLLIANKRLLIVSQILFLFEKIKAQAESVIDINITTAVDLEKNQQAELVENISAQLGKKITSEFRVDPEIIAGAVVRLGEASVVDGSLRTQLARMKEKFKS